MSLSAFVLTGLVCASFCWTCGYAFEHRRQLTGWIPRPARRDPVAREAARGVREIERYLALMPQPRRRY
ncbi:hypothetical protein ACIB24_00420 [Spongisporangium articulatum]|uniref:Uncharacterized protein n=1 Tax=Spongisporangium articulatum TaxID=3362603 RepID=A0ABW8AGP4_9ACTN